MHTDWSCLKNIAQHDYSIFINPYCNMSYHPPNRLMTFYRCRDDCMRYVKLPYTIVASRISYVKWVLKFPYVNLRNYWIKVDLLWMSPERCARHCLSNFRRRGYIRMWYWSCLVNAKVSDMGWSCMTCHWGVTDANVLYTILPTCICITVGTWNTHNVSILEKECQILHYFNTRSVENVYSLWSRVRLSSTDKEGKGLQLRAAEIVLYMRRDIRCLYRWREKGIRS